MNVTANENTNSDYEIIDQENRAGTGMEVAIIGMAGRFPGARNIDEFWENLKNGKESITYFSDDELEEAGIPAELLQNPNYVKANGILEDFDRFDASFFGYIPTEASAMAPQVRLFHECAWEGFENAGYIPDTYSGRIGLYAGASSSSRWEAMNYLSMTAKEEKVAHDFLSFAELITNSQLTDKDNLTTRISYKFNLTGPSFLVQTACSTSLVATHLAVQGLLAGECEMAAAGGTAVNIIRRTGYLYQEGGILSSDGHNRAFDARAKGTVGGDGAGVVILKLLEDAVNDGDYIYAVIRGSAINNDGFRKVGYTAPSVEGQAEVISTAQHIAEIEPGSISYIEAHGTATELGDPVEIEALKLAFTGAVKKGFCALGTVKSNIGHVNAAAGAAGLIKTVLALQHRQIPPSLHYNSPNPKIDFKNSPFYVNTELREWRNEQYPLRAGVSSFGIGGTNAHLVLEEAPNLETTGKTSNTTGKQYELILLSARTPSALDKMTGNLVNYLKRIPGNLCLPDIAYTLQVGRKPMPYREMLVCPSKEINEAIDALATRNSRKVLTGLAEETGSLVFMFPGVGSGYSNMGVDLYRAEPIFREAMDRCFEILKPLLNYDIKKELYPPSEDKSINQTIVSPTGILIFEYALAKLLMSWGIRPTAMIGYSLGEYTAACLAGVFDLEDALKLFSARDRLIRQLPKGMMLGVPLPREQLEPLLTGNSDLGISIDNGPSCVVSGPWEIVSVFEEEMKKKRFICTPVKTVQGIHSPMMEPILKEFTAMVGRVSLKKPKIPFISNVTGKWINDQEAVDPVYWAKQLRGTVRFSEGIQELLKTKNPIFVEVGPGRDLCSLLVRYGEGEDKPGLKAVNLVRRPEQETTDDQFLLDRIGRLWLFGAPMDWSKFQSDKKRHRVALPTYPFESQRFPASDDSLQLGAKFDMKLPAQHLEMARKSNIADWFYAPLWEQSMLSRDAGKNEPVHWLIFSDNSSLSVKLVETLKARGHGVSVATTGAGFHSLGEKRYTLDPQRADDYNALFRQLAQAKEMPQRILHLWNIDVPDEDGIENRDAQGLDWVDRAMDLGFYSLLDIVTAVDRMRATQEIQLNVVVSCQQDVYGDEFIKPERATMTGALGTIRREYPYISCRCIDIIPPSPNSPQEAKLLENLVLEFSGDKHHEQDALEAVEIAAWRGVNRWVRRFKPYHPKGKENPGKHIKEAGVYLVTGGLGGIGMVFARRLAMDFKGRLILVGRSFFPPAEQWEEWLMSHEDSDPISSRIRELREMQASGAQILIFSTDVSDLEAMREVIKKATQRFGPINGVIHAAGTADYEGIIQGRTRQATDMVLSPKIKGTLVLDYLLKDTALDFVILCSSLSSFLAPLGQVGYSVANAFLDAFARGKAIRTPGIWMSIDWGIWQVGMSVEAVKKQHKDPLNLLGEGISPSEGVQVLDLFLGHRLSQVAICPVDLEVVIRKMAGPEPDATPSPGETGMERIEAVAFSPRPGLSVEYAAPRDLLEQALADIWQSYFGLEKIGIYDNFFELGGDSLKGMMLLNQYKTLLGEALPVAIIFDVPTIAKLAEYFIKNYPQGAARIRQGDAAKTKQENNSITIQPVEKKEYYPLSSAQKRLYILHRMDPGNTAYNTTLLIGLDGQINKEKLEKTLKKLIVKHESLRTSFFTLNEEVFQKVHKEVEFKVDIQIDVDGKDKIHNPSLIFHHFINSFDLSSAPLLRVGLIKETEGKHIMMVDLHHIICDGTSVWVLVREFVDLYAGKEMSPLRIQYKDYTLWQNSESEKKRLKKQEDWWLREFSGEIPVLQLPLDFSRPETQSFEGRKEVFETETGAATALKKLAQENGVTLYMLLLSFFSIFLYKLSGQEEIVIGAPIANRRHSDLESIIGMFVNALALQTCPQGDKTFKEFLKEIKEKTLAAFENQEYPFEDLVGKVVFNRDPGRNPLFDTVFILQNIEIPILKIPGLTIKPYDYETKTAKFDLTLEAFETTTGENGEKLGFTLEYCTRLFRSETIGRFIDYFNRILFLVITDPDMEIGQIEIISEAEKRIILEDFNAMDCEYPREKTIHRLFEEQVEKASDNIALVGVDAIETLRATSLQITYRQLNEKAGNLAGSLIEKDVLADDIVGIMMERSIDLIIGIMGILKSGAAYLPIDTEYPKERIDYMLNDSRVKVLLGTKEIQEKIIVNCKRMTPHQALFQHSSHLAYIMYTSGSTGQPKGVMVTHRNVVRLVKNTNFVPLTEETRILQTGAPVFDATTFEIWGSLLNAGQLVLVDKQVILDAHRLGNAVKSYCINTLWLSAPLFNQSMQENIELFAPLHYLLVGGDVLSPEHIKQVRVKFPGLKIINGYGPTENTTFSTTYLIEKDIVHNIPIGRPIANSKAYIYDKYNRLAPIGITGELVVGGDGVACGYLNNPELTAEKFNRTNKTYSCYKTGDLVRWLNEGNIEFLGRIDQQVKIRGFRIELGEIENRLLIHGAVKDAVVVCWESGHGDKYLCAYITAASTTFESNSLSLDLKEYLSRIFPNYMLPSYYVLMDRIPLTPNGKVDRKALPKPEIKVDSDYIAPFGQNEAILAEIWAEVLEIEKDTIGRDTNFFDLGGHSLKAVSLIGRIEKRFHATISLTTIFSNPTIRKMAKRVIPTDKYQSVSISALEEKEFYPLTSMQQKFFVLNQLQTMKTAYNIPSLLIVEGSLDREKLKEAFFRIIQRHAALRTSFILVDNEPVQRVYSDVNFELEYNTLADSDTEVEYIKRFIRPFDLSQAPLLRVGLLKISEEKHILMFDMHHIISDGTSVGILMRDMVSLYGGDNLPPLPIQYKDFSQWINSPKGQDILARQEAYWLNQYKEKPPTAKMYTDFPRPPVQSFVGDNIYFSLGEELTLKIKRLMTETGATLFMVLLAGLNILLSAYTGQEDIVVGAPIAGRMNPDLNDIIGLLINALPIRNYPRKDKTFSQFLAEIIENTINAYENQLYPFANLLEKLDIEKDLSRNPLFDVELVVLNMEIPTLEVEGLRFTPYDYKWGVTQLDIDIYVSESEKDIWMNLFYCTELFKKETIDGFIAFFKEIISTTTDNVEIKIKDIKMKYELASAGSTTITDDSDDFGF
ncbi:MAG: hypothetical protein QG657_16 [Acidobacteriota bacterium]|nr:hypothetical protein [Acidobacteriota bacterium]